MKTKNAVRDHCYSNVRLYNCPCVYPMRSFYLCTALRYCLGLFHSRCRALLNGGFPGGSGKGSACQRRRRRFSPWVRKIPWRRRWQPTPIFLPGKSHGQSSLVGLATKQLSWTFLTGQDLVVTASLNICLSGNVLFLTSSWRSLAGFRVLSWQLFIF